MKEEYPMNKTKMEEEERKTSKEVNVSKMYSSQGVKSKNPNNDDMEVELMIKEHPINKIKMEDDAKKIPKEADVSQMYSFQAMKFKHPKNDEMKVEPMIKEYPINNIKMEEEEERKISKDVNVSKMYSSQAVKSNNPKNDDMKVEPMNEEHPPMSKIEIDEDERKISKEVKKQEKNMEKTELGDMSPRSIQSGKSLYEVCVSEEVINIKPQKRILNPNNHENINGKSEFEEYFDIIFPRKVHEDILKDEEIILAENSDFRIIWFLIGLSILLIGILLSLWVSILGIVDHQPIILQPNIPYTGRIKPKIYFAIILQNKTVLNMSPYGQVEKMCQLPAGAKKYHGYADEQGVLYFIDGELQKPIFQYSKRNGLIKFKTRSNVDPKIRNMYQTSASVGPYFWLLGEINVNVNHEIANLINHEGILSGTKLWYKERKIMNKGPKLPNEIVDSLGSSKFCLTSLNRTHLMVLGFSLCLAYNPWNGECKNAESAKRTAIVNMNNQNWTQISMLHFNDIDFDNDYVTFQGCSATQVFDKHSGSRKVVVHYTTKKSYLVPLSSELATIKSYIETYDLSNGTNAQWIPVREASGKWNLDGQLLTINGVLHSFMVDGSIRGFWSNYTDFEITSKFMDISMFDSVVPYLA